MDYQQTIDYLFSRLPLFSRIGAAAYKKDLHNIIALCDTLGNPQQDFPCIHIAGTNGKGSTSHMLAAILQTAGYKTGLYTSPHLKDFRERIRVNGEMISEAAVIGFTQRLQPQIESLEPSFFEITVAMAFEYFAQQQVDVAVIETGLGGRLDSTNIITPLLSIITNISFDHMNILGDTLEAIAGEKAGIIKKNIPVVIGQRHHQTTQVFLQKSKAMEAPLFFAADEFAIVETHHKSFQLTVDMMDNRSGIIAAYQLDLNGSYQPENLRTVLTALRLLQKDFPRLREHSIKEALSKVKAITGLRGRWDVLQENPMVVLDVAHNEDGMRLLMQQVSVLPKNALHIVIGMVKDKDIDHILRLLPQNAGYYFTQAQIPRALPAEDLAALAVRYQLTGAHYPNVNSALAAAKAAATSADLIIVCGSVFVVGEVAFGI
jgi:dihydrofolate synthase / folylpolyglutamate synthase